MLTCCTLAFFVMLRPMSIPTGAMENALLIEDQILVTNQPGREPGRRDIVVFQYPVDRRQTFIKRVVGLPGDRLRIVNKKLFVNDVAAVEPYAYHSTTYNDSYRDNFPSEANLKLYPGAEDMLSQDATHAEVFVPGSKYFVMGQSR